MEPSPARLGYGTVRGPGSRASSPGLELRQPQSRGRHGAAGCGLSPSARPRLAAVLCSLPGAEVAAVSLSPPFQQTGCKERGEEAGPAGRRGVCHQHQDSESDRGAGHWDWTRGTGLPGSRGLGRAVGEPGPLHPPSSRSGPGTPRQEAQRGVCAACRDLGTQSGRQVFLSGASCSREKHGGLAQRASGHGDTCLPAIKKQTGVQREEEPAVPAATGHTGPPSELRQL